MKVKPQQESCLEILFVSNLFLSNTVADKANFGYPVPSSLGVTDGPYVWKNMTNIVYLLANTEFIRDNEILYAIEMYAHTAGEIRLYVSRKTLIICFYLNLFCQHSLTE